MTRGTHRFAIIFGMMFSLLGCVAVQSQGVTVEAPVGAAEASKSIELKIVYETDENETQPGLITIWVKNGGPEDFHRIHAVILDSLTGKFAEKFVSKEMYQDADWLNYEYLYEKDVKYKDGNRTTFILHAGSISWHGKEVSYGGVWVELVCPAACDPFLISALLEEKAVAPLSRDAKEKFDTLKFRLTQPQK